MIEEEGLEVDVDLEYATIVELHQEMGSILTRDSIELSCVIPAISKWSTATQIEHVLLANQMVTRGLLALAAGKFEGAKAGDMNRLGRLLLGRGIIPRGKAQTPDLFSPSPESDIATIVDMSATVSRNISLLKGHLQFISEMSEGFEHPFFGVLPAPVWIRFIHVHTLHHLKIVREILSHVPDKADSI